MSPATYQKLPIFSSCNLVRVFGSHKWQHTGPHRDQPLSFLEPQLPWPLVCCLASVLYRHIKSSRTTRYLTSNDKMELVEVAGLVHSEVELFHDACLEFGDDLFMPASLYSNALFNWILHKYHRQLTTREQIRKFHDAVKSVWPFRHDARIHTSAGLPAERTLIGCSLHRFPRPENP